MPVKRVGWPVCGESPTSAPISTCIHLDFRPVLLPQLYVGASNSNSGPHTLSTEASPQASQSTFYVRIKSAHLSLQIKEHLQLFLVLCSPSRSGLLWSSVCAFRFFPSSCLLKQLMNLQDSEQVRLFQKYCPACASNHNSTYSLYQNIKLITT